MYMVHHMYLFSTNFNNLNLIIVLVSILIIYLQSLDYDTCENHLLLDEERKRGYPFVVWKDIARWFIILLIGIVTALIAFFIDICIEEFSEIKYRELKKCILLKYI